MTLSSNIKKIHCANTSTYLIKGENTVFHKSLLQECTNLLKTEEISRFLLHDSINSDLHNMVISIKKETFIYPHKHEKTESYHILEGDLLLVYFEDNGNIKKYVRLSPSNTLIARVDQKQYHAIIILSEYAIFHEIRLGPFEQNHDSTFANWSELEQEKVLYMKNILKKYEEEISHV